MTGRSLAVAAVLTGAATAALAWVAVVLLQGFTNLLEIIARALEGAA